MSKHPWPGVDGQPQHLRGTVYAHLILPARVGLGIGIASDQVVKLKAGEDVVLTREQLGQFGHPDLPVNLDDHEHWTLSGDSTLTPVT